jgi:hypothetical protein
MEGRVLQVVVGKIPVADACVAACIPSFQKIVDISQQNIIHFQKLLYKLTNFHTDYLIAILTHQT